MNESDKNTETAIDCWIYKSTKKVEMYLYLAEEDGFSELPESLQASFGQPIFVMQLGLSDQRPLARADSAAVIRALVEQGYYLQMPPKLDPNLYFGD